jgi:hypothetical protein
VISKVSYIFVYFKLSNLCSDGLSLTNVSGEFESY